MSNSNLMFGHQANSTTKLRANKIRLGWNYSSNSPLKNIYLQYQKQIAMINIFNDYICLLPLKGTF